MKNLIKTVTTNISRATGRTGLLLQKNAPDLYTAAGVVGMGVSLYLAAKGVLYCMRDVDTYRYVKRHPISEVPENTTEEELKELQKTEIKEAKKKMVVSVAKAYTPCAAVFAVSTASILTGHNLLKKRYLGAVSAFNVVSGAFGDYRARVKEELGEEADRHFLYGTEKETVNRKVIDTKGNEKTVTEEIEVIPGCSQYARYFSKSTSTQWDPNLNIDLMFLRGQREMANVILQTRGHIFLNEIYDMLGMEHTQAGTVTGWVLGAGDDYIDFGVDLTNYSNLETRVDSSDGLVALLLDFNCDGVIWDKI